MSDGRDRRSPPAATCLRHGTDPGASGKHGSVGGIHGAARAAGDRSWYQRRRRCPRRRHDDALRPCWCSVSPPLPGSVPTRRRTDSRPPSRRLGRPDRTRGGAGASPPEPVHRTTGAHPTGAAPAGRVLRCRRRRAGRQRRHSGCGRARGWQNEVEALAPRCASTSSRWVIIWRFPDLAGLPVAAAADADGSWACTPVISTVASPRRPQVCGHGSHQRATGRDLRRLREDGFHPSAKGYSLVGGSPRRGGGLRPARPALARPPVDSRPSTTIARGSRRCPLATIMLPAVVGTAGRGSQRLGSRPRRCGWRHPVRECEDSERQCARTPTPMWSRLRSCRGRDLPERRVAADVGQLVVIRGS
jgi:hypothetical protein